MTDKLKQIIKEEVGKLPKENQEILNAFGWEQMSEEIGKKYLLNESEVNDFQVETLLVLIGLEDPISYANNIENNVGTTKADAEKMASEVIEKIFVPINDKLIENLKKSGVIKNSKWDQNLNFILSGGDYSALVERPEPKKDLPETTQTPPSPMLTPSLADIRNNLQKASPQSKTQKITDIKSKFNI